MRMLSFSLVACLAAAFEVPVFGDNEIRNAGLENLDGEGWAAGWERMGNAKWCADNENSHSGKFSFSFDLNDESTPAYNRVGGMRYRIVYRNPSKDPVRFGAWSRSEMVLCDKNYECYLSVGYDDGTWDWTLTDVGVLFSQGSHGWEKVESVCYPQKPVKELVLQVGICKGVGKAWFDDLFLERGEPGPILLGYRRRTLRPYADEDRLLLKIPPKEMSWSSEARGCLECVRGEGRGSRFVEIPVLRSACDVHLKLWDDQRTNSYDIILGASVLPESPVADNQVKVWTACSTRKITPLTYPSERDMVNPSIALDVAQGGSASAQILVTSGRLADRPSVNVEIGALKSDSGRQFAGQVKWERVGYVERQVDSISPLPGGPDREERFLPDPLFPAAPFHLRANATQSAWLTFVASRTDKPGTYRGMARVRVSDREIHVVPIALTVRSFALPERFGVETAFANIDSFSHRMFPDDTSRIDRNIQDIMLDHRINADNMYRWTLPKLEDVRHAIDRGANRFALLCLVMPPPDRYAVAASWPAPEDVAKPEFLAHFNKLLTPFIEELRREDLIKYAYLYGFDENNREHFKVVDELWRTLKRMYPELPVLTTARMYRDMSISPEGTNVPFATTTDWYCPLTSVWKPELTRQLQSMGKKVWWYTCCGPLTPFANFASLECDWVESRILFWQHYIEKADGFLYWTVNWWHKCERSDESDVYQIGPKIYSDNWVQGDGQLVYAGRNGVYPTIRLANIRDGIQDCEWLRMAERHVSREACETVCRGFIRSLIDYDRDTETLLEKRAQIGRMLE